MSLLDEILSKNRNFAHRSGFNSLLDFMHSNPAGCCYWINSTSTTLSHRSGSKKTLSVQDGVSSNLHAPESHLRLLIAEHWETRTRGREDTFLTSVAMLRSAGCRICPELKTTTVCFLVSFGGDDATTEQLDRTAAGTSARARVSERDTDECVSLCVCERERWMCVCLLIIFLITCVLGLCFCCASF